MFVMKTRLTEVEREVEDLRGLNRELRVRLEMSDDLLASSRSSVARLTDERVALGKEVETERERANTLASDLDLTTQQMQMLSTANVQACAEIDRLTANAFELTEEEGGILAGVESALGAWDKERLPLLTSSVRILAGALRRAAGA